jgi:3-deoxy-D-manno-octulosonate 8-phosphate phosphatase (KDO 8-P phosphatase)
MTPELKKRAAAIRWVLTDCDGVLTDGGVYYSERGEEMKRFNMRDGMGVKRLRLAGIHTAIVTGEKSPSVARRAEKLGIVELHLGCRDKLALVTSLLARLELNWSQIAYIGDDINDMKVLRQAGLSASPADAVQSVRDCVHVVLEQRGGQGAFRELAELILSETSLPVDAHD